MDEGKSWKDLVLSYFTEESWYLYPCARRNVYGCTLLEHKCQGPDLGQRSVLTAKPLES